MPAIPFSDSVTSPSDANGNVTFSGFQIARLGRWKVGTFSVVDSQGNPPQPATVLPITWKAYVGGAGWGTWYNDQPSNPVQASSQVVVKGANLLANTQYQCVWIGYESDNPPLLSPIPAPAPPPAGPISLYNSLLSPGVAVPANTEQFLVGLTAGVLVGAPVLLGTSSKLTCYNTTTAIHIELGWGPTPSVGSVIEEFAFDMDASAPVPGLSGLVLPNLDTRIFLAIKTGNSPANVQIELLTGLPPITRPALGPLPNTVLLGATGLAINSGATGPSLPIPPYVGPALLNITGNGVSGGPWYAYIISMDYLGNMKTKMFFIPSLSEATGSVNIIESVPVNLPPLRNSLTIANNSGFAGTFDYALIAAGP